MKDLGIYIHLPYCIQRCHYCDFATFEQSQILPPSDYVEFLLREINLKSSFFLPRELASVYLGGGTPSLVPPFLISKIFSHLERAGFTIGAKTEVTIEINPATLTQESLDFYLEIGVNRFSVGAQTFSNSHLKILGREHNVKDTLQTLELLKSRNLNMSLDLLYSLPGQDIKSLQFDLDQIFQIDPSHVSAYCLTLPQSHPLQKNRPIEDAQAEMFHFVRNSLEERGFTQYEISNFAKPNCASQHNLLYWTEQEYWGIGLSSHSFSAQHPYGIRFWNDRNINHYLAHVEKGAPLDGPQFLSKELFEILSPSESLTDHCHVCLRLNQGLDFDQVDACYPAPLALEGRKQAERAREAGFLERRGRSIYRLTTRGQVLSNLVFEYFTFVE